jgi:hypothetical protein
MPARIRQKPGWKTAQRYVRPDPYRDQFRLLPLRQPDRSEPVRPDPGSEGLHRRGAAQRQPAGRQLRAGNAQRANLSGANLSDAKLGQAYANHATFSGANLTGADLTQAELTGANFTGANLSHASLIQATATGANFAHARLTSTDFTQAEIGNATFTGVKGLLPLSNYLLLGAVVIFVLLALSTIAGRLRGMRTFGGGAFGNAAVVRRPVRVVRGLIGAFVVALGFHLFLGGLGGTILSAAGPPVTATCSSGIVCTVGVSSGFVGISQGSS